MGGWVGGFPYLEEVGGGGVGLDPLLGFACVVFLCVLEQGQLEVFLVASWGKVGGWVGGWVGG